MKSAEKCAKVDLVQPDLKNTRKRHKRRKILSTVSVENYASHLLVSKVIAGLMTDNNNTKKAMVMLV